MADKTQSDSDAARIKRGTLPVKIKRKQPFVLESFLCHAEGGRTKAKYQKNETIFRQGDSADAVFYIMDGKCKVTVVSEKGKEAVVAHPPSSRRCGPLGAGIPPATREGVSSVPTQHWGWGVFRCVSDVSAVGKSPC